MLLYRARTDADRPRRQPAFAGNDPAVRIRGRWFTSDLSRAVAHLLANPAAVEIVSIDVPDDIVESFNVARTPVTVCGLEPGAHSDRPELDYVVQTFRVMDAQPVGTATMVEYWPKGANAPRAPRLVDRIDVDARNVRKAA